MDCSHHMQPFFMCTDGNQHGTHAYACLIFLHVYFACSSPLPNMHIYKIHWHKLLNKITTFSLNLEHYYCQQSNQMSQNLSEAPAGPFTIRPTFLLQTHQVGQGGCAFQSVTIPCKLSDTTRQCQGTLANRNTSQHACISYRSNLAFGISYCSNDLHLVPSQSIHGIVPS